MDDRAKLIVSFLLKNNAIPSGKFEIEETHLQEYCKAYAYLNGKKEVSSLKKKNNYTLARKLAAINLLLHQEENYGVKRKDLKGGFVYLLENESYPEHYKIGMTVDVTSRLASYQTADPYRRFRIKNYQYVHNRRHTEEILLNSFSVELENESGEWVKRNHGVVLMFLDNTKVSKIW